MLIVNIIITKFYYCCHDDEDDAADDEWLLQWNLINSKLKEKQMIFQVSGVMNYKNIVVVISHSGRVYVHYFYDE